MPSKELEKKEQNKQIKKAPSAKKATSKPKTAQKQAVDTKAKKAHTPKKTEKEKLLDKARARKVEILIENNKRKEALQREKEEEARKKYLAMEKQKRKNKALSLNIFGTTLLLILVLACAYFCFHPLAFCRLLQTYIPNYSQSEAFIAQCLVVSIYCTILSVLIYAPIVIAQFVLSICSKTSYRKTGEYSLIHKGTAIMSIIGFVIEVITLVGNVLVFIFTHQYYTTFGYSYNILWTLIPMIAFGVMFVIALVNMIMSIIASKKAE